MDHTGDHRQSARPLFPIDSAGDAENVAQVSSEKLLAIAELPSRLVDVNQRQEQQRLRHVETSLAITACARNGPGGYARHPRIGEVDWHRLWL
ncbi:MAG: hypothetical protein R2838_09615 [Caldilineaceae bacterium]